MDLSGLNAQLEALSEQELLSLPVINQWLQRNAKEFELDALPDEFKANEVVGMRLRIIRRPENQWGVRDWSETKILDRDGRWASWPIPTEQVSSSRFDLPEAFAAARRELPKLRQMGMDSRQFTQWLRKRKEGPQP